MKRQPLRRIMLGAALAAGVVLVAAACGSSSKSAASSSTSAASTGGAAAGATTGTKSPLVVGVVGDWTGSQSQTSAPQLAAVKAWSDWENAKGGINGHPVRLIVKDDQDTPGTGLAAVKELVEVDHVIALVGTHAVSTETAWGSYIASQHVPVVGGESDTGVWLTNPYFFVSGEPGVNTITSQVYLAKLIGKLNLGSINLGNIEQVGPLIQLFQNGAKQFGVNYVYHAIVGASQPDYTAPCLAARSAHVEILALQLDPGTAAKVSGACNTQGFNPSYQVPSGAYLPSMNTLSQFDGTYVPTNNFLWFADTPAATTFRQAMQQYAPGTPLGPSATTGWASGMLFAAAAQNISDPPSAQGVLNGLYALPPNDTLGGVAPGATFKAGQPAQTTACFFLAQISSQHLTAPKGTGVICPS